MTVRTGTIKSPVDGVTLSFQKKLKTITTAQAEYIVEHASEYAPESDGEPVWDILWEIFEPVGEDVDDGRYEGAISYYDFINDITFIVTVDGEPIADCNFSDDYCVEDYDYEG